MEEIKKMTMPVQLDGEVKLRVDRRPSIKLKSDPHIVVCMPIGDKNTSTVMECPKDSGGCGSKWAAPGMRIPALVPIQWALSHMNMVTPLNTTMSYLTEWGRLSAEARQIMTQQAIRMKAKYILYWDDDTLPPPMGLYTLHNWMERHPEAGAVSGVYTTRVEPNEPLIYTHHGEGAAWDFPMGPGADPVPIFGAGAGFLLVRVEAIVDIQAKLPKGTPIWADERTLPGGDTEKGEESHNRKIMWGHDIRFCQLLNKHDWPVYVHGAVLCAHHDINTNVTFHVPDDAPGLVNQQRANINTQAYWNYLYGEEGINTYRRYEEMFGEVEKEIYQSKVDARGETVKVTELGCGMGVLAQRLVATQAIAYKGYDISDVAVEACKARFLTAEQLDLSVLQPSHIEFADVVVATEVMEHLDESVFNRVTEIVLGTPGVKKFVFTVPDNCLGPDELPEHTALFNEELVRSRLDAYVQDEWELNIRSGDDTHIICVLTRR